MIRGRRIEKTRFVCERPHNVNGMTVRYIGAQKIHQLIPDHLYTIDYCDDMRSLFLFDETLFDRDERDHALKWQYDYMVSMDLYVFYDLPFAFCPLDDCYYQKHKKAFYERYTYEYDKRGELYEYGLLVQKGVFRFNYQNENYQAINDKINEKRRRLFFERANKALGNAHRT